MPKFNLGGLTDSGFFWFLVILTGWLVIEFIHYYFVFKQIQCKVTEKDGRIRYTHFRHYKRRKVYKLHQLDGKWIKIDKEHTLTTEIAYKKKKILHFNFSTDESKK